MDDFVSYDKLENIDSSKNVEETDFVADDIPVSLASDLVYSLKSRTDMFSLIIEDED